MLGQPITAADGFQSALSAHAQVFAPGQRKEQVGQTIAFCGLLMPRERQTT
jgi:hypothetical protein